MSIGEDKVMKLWRWLVKWTDEDSHDYPTFQKKADWRRRMAYILLSKSEGNRY